MRKFPSIYIYTLVAVTFFICASNSYAKAPKQTVQSQERPSESSAQSNDILAQLKSLRWQSSPGTGLLGNEATITITQGSRFLSAPETNRFLVLQGNLPCKETSCYTLAATDFRWFVRFEFDPSGYVRDDEAINPDELLQILKENSKNELEERKQQGLPPIYLDGWYVPPHYDEITKRLEWGTQVHNEEGKTFLNYTIKLLGRNGVMNAMLVSDPETIDDDLRVFKRSLDGFSFKTGKSYAEYREGDKVAGYGLAALIVGGAAAAATKSGIWKSFAVLGAAWGKAIVIGLIALAAGIINFLKNLFKRT